MISWAEVCLGGLLIVFGIDDLRKHSKGRAIYHLGLGILILTFGVSHLAHVF